MSKPLYGAHTYQFTRISLRLNEAAPPDDQDLSSTAPFIRTGDNVCNRNAHYSGWCSSQSGY